jgi:hypothetical protein
MQRRLERFQEKRMVIDDQEMHWLHHASLHGEAARTSSSVPALIRPAFHLGRTCSAIFAIRSIYARKSQYS